MDLDLLSFWLGIIVYDLQTPFIRQSPQVQIVQEKAVGEVRLLAGERVVPTGGIGLTSDGPPANCPMRAPRPEELQTARPPFFQRAGWGILPWRPCPLRGYCR
ncbi:MAG: hypothetical protein JRF62_17730 [Deltaproteobacteria bacterium]|nr:hypothetical protein [Deltaproteobacteria bacterium]